MPKSEERPYTLSLAQSQDGPALSLGGRLSTMHLAAFLKDAKKAVVGLQSGPSALDLAGLEYLDTGGALGIYQLIGWAGTQGRELTPVGMTDHVKSILDLVGREEKDLSDVAPAAPKQGLVASVGQATIDLIKDLKEVVEFIGELVAATILLFRRPKMLRLKDVVLYMELVGVDGLPIVGLIALLLGLIIAFMSSLQLKAFGADIYVASLVGIAMVRELGPIMTAILVAGRSGSSFAAEIGTMKVNEEVDALVVMGFSPTVFLAVPKIIAAVLMVPLLTLFADLLAILGGLIVGVTGLDLTVYSYVNETMKALSVFDITTGMLKSAVFAFLIAAVGCQRGFTARGGAEAVGRVTTAAVVAAMFLIIVADSVFAIMLYYF